MTDYFEQMKKITREHYAKLLAESAIENAKEIDYEGRHENFIEQVDEAEHRRKQTRDEP